MTEIYPSFYFGFQCKAGDCLHSCCKGWEIDIDEETASFYMKMPGSLGEFIRSSIVLEDDSVHFALSENGNCPLLMENGLCRLIAEQGEDSISDICALHPRFYEEIGKFELSGLGLSCEKTCELLFQGSDPLMFVLGDADMSLSFDSLLDLLQISYTEDQLIFTPDLSEERISYLLDQFAKTEPIDKKWSQEMENLQFIFDHLTDSVQEFLPQYNRTLFDKLYQYIIFRQLDRLNEYSFQQICDYAKISTEYIFLKTALDDAFTEHVRRWSEQIEYSTDNVKQLLSL